MPSITAEKLQTQLDKHQYAPIYVLHGPESYFIDYFVNIIASEVLSEGERGFNQQVFYGKDSQMGDILNACQRYPMMAERQVIILKEAQHLRKWDGLEHYAAHPAKTTLFVIAHKDKTMDKRSKAYKALMEKAQVFEAKQIKEDKVAPWAIDYVKSRKRRLDPKAAALLTEYQGNKLDRVANALDKIILATDEGHLISTHDIEQHVGISREYNVFELTRHMATGDKARLSRMLVWMGSHPKENPLPMILAVLYGFFSRVAAMNFTLGRSVDALKDLGITGWNMKEYDAAHRAFGHNTDRIMQLLQDYDLRFKGVNDTGTAEGDLLKELILKIMLLRR